ncbi:MULTISPECIES: hypothetical protein [Aerococcus]|uniref:hypothetical protein n=1 Tax=Aerococcus TaxID=1375 RepID=UPI003D6BCAEF
MKFSKSVLLFASVIVLSGCGMFGQDTASRDAEIFSQSESTSSGSSDEAENESESSTEESSEDTSSEKASSDISQTPDDNSVSAIIEAIQVDVASDYVDYIPTDIPLPEGITVFPTAYTSKTGQRIKMDFYGTEEQVPYGDERLANGEFDDAKIASITIDNYDSDEAAAEQISQNNYAEIGGEAIDLGYGITGYMDAGAGQIHTSWNEGHWDFSIQAQNDGSDDGLTLASTVVQYLEENLLTAPEDYGMGRFSVSNPETNYLSFQKGNKVITIDGNTNPFELTDFATYIK